jgi:hypothetical protein
VGNLVPGYRLFARHLTYSCHDPNFLGSAKVGFFGLLPKYYGLFLGPGVKKQRPRHHSRANTGTNRYPPTGPGENHRPYPVDQ